MMSTTQNRRRVALASMAGGIAIVLSGCASAGATDDGSDTSEYSFEFAIHTGESDLMSQINQSFIDEVAERSDGRITINPHYSGSLVPPDQVLDSVESGTIDLGHVTTSFASGAIPDLAILEVPYARPADAAGYADFSAEVDPLLGDIFAQHNQKFLYSNPGIQPGIIACAEPAGPDADLTDLLIRAAGPWQSETLAGWGASPATIGTAELYTALQNGTVECTLQVYNLYNTLKLPEVAPYLYRLEFGANYNAITMNQNAWDSLSAEDQDILIAAGEAAHEQGFELLADSIAPTIETLTEAGVEFCLPSRDSIDAKLDAVDDVRAEIAGAVTETGQELLDISESYRDAAFQKPEFGPTDECE